MTGFAWRALTLAAGLLAIAVVGTIVAYAMVGKP